MVDITFWKSLIQLLLVLSTMLVDLIHYQWLIVKRNCNTLYESIAMLTTLNGNKKMKTNLLFILPRVFIGINCMYRLLQYILIIHHDKAILYYTPVTCNFECWCSATWSFITFLRWKLVQGCMHVQSEIPKMYGSLMWFCIESILLLCV